MHGLDFLNVSCIIGIKHIEYVVSLNQLTSINVQMYIIIYIYILSLGL